MTASVCRAGEATGWPSEGAETAVSIASGWTHIYDYQDTEETRVNHQVLRLDATVLHHAWLVELDAQWIGVGQERPSDFVDAVLGHRLYGGRRAPHVWLTGDLLWFGDGPGGVLEDRLPFSPGAGLHLQMPLVFLEQGETAWAIRWYPLAGLYYKSMHVGWRVGPLGFRVGGLGMRDRHGRLWSGFTSELCWRF